MLRVGPLAETASSERGTETVPTAAIVRDEPSNPRLGRALELQRIFRSTEFAVAELSVSTRQLSTTWTETNTTELRLSARAERDARATALMASRNAISNRALLVLGK
jgi:hypothetical protein